MLIPTASLFLPLLAFTNPTVAHQQAQAQAVVMSDSTSSPSSAPSLHDRLIHVLPQVEQLKKIGGTAGISIGIMSQGHLVLDHSLGFANIERKIQPSFSQKYPIASITKAFVASIIAQLVHDGLLKWDEALTTYIPELSFEHDSSLANQLTLIDILSHRTGLARLDALWLGADSQTFTSKNFTVAICNHLPPVYQIRSKFLYNNWMYALAGEIIERVTKKTWGEVLQERILTPLGLSNTTAISSQIPPDSLAVPYMVLDDLTPVRVGDMNLTDGSIMTSAGGIRSTVGDLLTWGNILLSLYRDDETPLKSLETIFQGHTFINSTINSDELYAMGFAKAITPSQFGKIGFNPMLIEPMPVIGSSSQPQQVFYHSGAGAGYNHCYMLVPGLQAVIVVLTNSVSQGDTADWIAQTLLQAVIDDKKPVDLTPLAEKAAVKWNTIHQSIVDTLEKDRNPDTEEPPHDALEGKYLHGTGSFYLDVFQNNGELRFNLNGKPEQEHVLSHYNKDTFIFLPTSEKRLRSGLFHYSAPAWLLHFKKDSEGIFTEIDWNLDTQSPFPERFTRE